MTGEQPEQPEQPDALSFQERISLEGRIARLENEVEHKASREDMANLKVWALTAVLGALVTLVVAATTIAARFWPS